MRTLNQDVVVPACEIKNVIWVMALDIGISRPPAIPRLAIRVELTVGT